MKAIISILGLFILFSYETPLYLSHVVNPQQQNLRLYWKDSAGDRYKSLGKLKRSLEEEGKELVFAMNGGMYQKDGSPLGLYIEDGKILAPINTVQEAYGNFYLQPNGIFYLTKDNKAGVYKTPDLPPTEQIQYATQSGPMLVIDGNIHPKFSETSTSVHYRNGVGILPDGKILFVMSKEKVNLYTFASIFLDHGCQNALYLDGFVSKTYLPEQEWEQTGGNFGVIIGEVK